MPRKRHKPEEIAAKFRQVDVLVSQGRAVTEPVRAIGVTPFTDYRWRKWRVILSIGIPPIPSKLATTFTAAICLAVIVIWRI